MVNPDISSLRECLLLGGSGFVGRHIARALGPERARTTYRSNPVDGGVAFDAMTDDVNRLLDGSDSFSHVFVLFGVTNPDACITEPEKCCTCNVDRVAAVTRAANERGLPVVFFSTEAVFDGEDGPYDEQAHPNPKTLYGKTKLEAERLVAGLDSRNLIIRLARVYGTDPDDGTLCMGLLHQIQRGEEILCAVDQTFSPVHAEDAATAVLALSARGADGIYNVCGPQSLSRLQIVEQLIELYQVHAGPFQGRIKECRVGDLATLEPRPRNIGLSPDKMVKETGFMPATLAARMRAFFETLPAHA